MVKVGRNSVWLRSLKTTQKLNLLAWTLRRLALLQCDESCLSANAMSPFLRCRRSAQGVIFISLRFVNSELTRRIRNVTFWLRVIEVILFRFWCMYFFARYRIESASPSYGLLSSVRGTPSFSSIISSLSSSPTAVQFVTRCNLNLKKKFRNCIVERAAVLEIVLRDENPYPSGTFLFPSRLFFKV